MRWGGGKLKNSAEYVLSPASLSYTAVNASGWTITVCDPCSESKTLSSDGSGSVTGIAPGEWTVVVTDGTNVVSSKKLTFAGGRPTDAGTIGNPLAGKTIIFVKASSAPTIWAWEVSGEKVSLTEKLGYSWNSQPTMQEVSPGYMEKPDGWYMLDVSSVSSGGNISFKLNSSDSQKDSPFGTTFWYDGTSFYDSDPTANQLSSDATLASISVNGKPVEGFSAGTVSYNAVIAADAETAVVTAAASDSGAAVSVSPSGAVSVAQGSTKTFTITVTAADGKTEKTYTVSVKRAVIDDVSLANVSVNGKPASASGAAYTYAATGSDESFAVSSIVATPADPAATVTYSQTSGTVADGGSTNFTITVKNGAQSAAYTLTVTYTRREIVQSQYYWTNKDGAVGTNKTILSWSDWTEAERIAQCAAYDDPRTWTGIQEVPYDVYALYAAYDDTNLYVMVELTNIVDRATFMFHDYAASDNAWWNNRDIPLGLVINTGAAVTADGPYLSADSVIWGGATGGIEFTDSEKFDWLLYHSSKYGTFDGAFVGVGTPGVFHVTSSGYFSYEPEYCLSVNSGTTKGTSGIDIHYTRQCAVSKTIYFESTPADNRKTSKQDGKSLMESTTYTAVSTNDLDMSYWYTIPLSTLGMTKNDIQTRGIGIRQLTTGGGSLMDCCPWDESMVDVAGEYYSGADDYSSKEKEDVDTITSPLARIGHM